MNRFPLACPMVALLLISPLSGADPTQDATFEPAPVFEDEDLYAKAKRWEPRAAGKAAERTAPPVEASSVATPAQTSAPNTSAAQSASAVTPPAASSGQVKSKSAAAAQDPLKENMPIALLVLAAVGGFFMWRKGRKISGSVHDAPRPTHTEPFAPATGTGVERYLKSALGVGPAGETGVSRYLKTVVGAATGAAETGVARYLKNVTDTTSAAGPETGVARYLKNRT